jgi:hypothetical protein
MKSKAKKTRDKKVAKFLLEIKKLSKQYGLSISHQYFEGSFLVKGYCEKYTEWLLDADHGKYREYKNG